MGKQTIRVSKRERKLLESNFGLQIRIKQSKKYKSNIGKGYSNKG